jgi:hypothetical protein
MAELANVVPCSPHRRAFESWLSQDQDLRARLNLSLTPHAAPAPSTSTGPLGVLLCTAVETWLVPCLQDSTVCSLYCPCEWFFGLWVRGSHVGSLLKMAHMLLLVWAGVGLRRGSPVLHPAVCALLGCAYVHA